jgi:hypothetical protein
MAPLLLDLASSENSKGLARRHAYCRTRPETGLSEYQYYEFRALDRPLDEGDRRALRALSSRAGITATSFTNVYEWGDFKGDPAKLMERWFDLHVHVANWGSRRLMIRLPRRLADERRLREIATPARRVCWSGCRHSNDEAGGGPGLRPR